MALLHALWSLRTPLGVTVSAAHYHHGLREAEADRDADFVFTWCRREGIPLSIGRGDVAAFARESGYGLEDAARRLRYDYLLSLDHQAKILTGHTAEDNLETVLMHLIRGAGLHGLTGIPPENGRILRPMLDVTRQERDVYLSSHGIPHMEDSTNRSDAYLRNRLRHRVLPLLEAENPSLAASVSALTAILRREETYLDGRSREAFSDLTRQGNLDRPGLLALPEALRFRVLALFLAPVPQVSRVHLEAAMDLCAGENPSGSADLPGGYRLTRVYDRLILAPAVSPAPVPPAGEIWPGETLLFGPWLVSCERAPRPEALPPGALALSADQVTLPLTLRGRAPGDRLHLPGGTKKISRMMVDRKVPAHLRSTMPVICQGEEIAAVLPLAVSLPYRCEQIGRDSILLSAKRTED